MSKIAVVTDSNSGITQAQARELGIRVLPMPFMIDGKEYPKYLPEPLFIDGSQLVYKRYKK